MSIAVITSVRKAMSQLGGFYAAEPSTDGTFIHVRMVPGNEAKMETIRQQFPALNFEVHAYYTELHASE